MKNLTAQIIELRDRLHRVNDKQLLDDVLNQILELKDQIRCAKDHSWDSEVIRDQQELIDSYQTQLGYY
jgi:hypothetical protein